MWRWCLRVKEQAHAGNACLDFAREQPESVLALEDMSGGDRRSSSCAVHGPLN